MITFIFEYPIVAIAAGLLIEAIIQYEIKCYQARKEAY